MLETSKKQLFLEKKSKIYQKLQNRPCEGGTVHHRAREGQDAAGEAQKSLSTGGGCSGTLERWQDDNYTRTFHQIS